MVERRCPCGTAFTAARSTAKYCSDNCRKRAKRSGNAEKKPEKKATVTSIAEKQRKKSAEAESEAEQPAAPRQSPLVAAVTEQLKGVDRLNTVLGVQALALARRIDHSLIDTGSAVASLSKEFRSVMGEIMATAAKAGDELDAITERYDQLSS